MEGRLPCNRCVRDPRALDEERRLLYVAMTCSHPLLVMTYPVDTDTGFGTQANGTCSRFLEVLDDTEVDRIQLT